MEEGVACPPQWLPIVLASVPVQRSGEVAHEDGHADDDAKQSTPAGNDYHGPPSYDEPPSSLLVKADAHVPNVPYIVPKPRPEPCAQKRRASLHIVVHRSMLTSVAHRHKLGRRADGT